MLAECGVCAYMEAALVPCWLAGWGHLGICWFCFNARFVPIGRQPWSHVGWLAGAISASAASGSMHGLCLYGGSLGPMLAGWLEPSRHLLILAQWTVCAYMEAALLPCWLAGWGHLDHHHHHHHHCHHCHHQHPDRHPHDHHHNKKKKKKILKIWNGNNSGR